MALFKIFNNISSGNTIDSLSAHQEGYCYFDANTNKFYVDTTNAATGLRQLNGTYYGECSTAAATTAKVVTIAGFKLAVGASVYVKFTSANTGAVGSLTLNVSGTGAKPIKRYGTTNLAAAGNIGAGMVCNFVYDGTNWLWVNHIDTDSNTDTKVNVTLGATSKAYLTGVTTAPTSSAQALTEIADTDVFLDTTAGRLSAKSYAIPGSSNSSAVLSSDNANNAYIAIGSVYPFVVTNTVVRPGNSSNKQIDLGASSPKWKTLYVQTADTEVVKINNGSTTKNVSLEYDDTTEVLNFVFT